MGIAIAYRAPRDGKAAHNRRAIDDRAELKLAKGRLVYNVDRNARSSRSFIEVISLFFGFNI